tara:strand:+ start:1029 stop:1169 length:141 start_codon:yes stop_codon:yes gene_type:complete
MSERVAQVVSTCNINLRQIRADVYYFQHYLLVKQAQIAHKTETDIM